MQKLEYSVISYGVTSIRKGDFFFFRRNKRRRYHLVLFNVVKRPFQRGVLGIKSVVNLTSLFLLNSFGICKGVGQSFGGE